ncbi:MAG: 16S rRNA (cytidine(1402)-2'-O)-methyltransferase [Oscillospiraceae bacterium]|nr:16S rRNA (cytidine(1402)-2'-O)-methyltransferase [Oscillospiraceae bacterium]
MAGKLYVVATPIGNLTELSPRAVEILQSVERIACEDTRTSSVLLRRFGIDTPLMACHKFNEEAVTAQFIDIMLGGHDVALISDAGTPSVSDPGAFLVAAAVDAGIEVLPVTGSCALIAALSVSGFSGLSFGFYGFLPKEKKKIAELLTRADGDSMPIAVFYLSPHRLRETLELVAAHWDDAALCLCNDLTKLHERMYRGSPQIVMQAIEQNAKAGRGEYVLVVQKPPRQEERDEMPLSYEARLVDDIVRHGGTLKDAVARLSKEGLARNGLYDASLRVKGLSG